MDYIFRRLALDHLPFETRANLGIYSVDERTRYNDTGSYMADDESVVDPVSESSSALKATGRDAAATSGTAEQTSDRAADADVIAETAHVAPTGAHTSTELLEVILGSAADAPLCMDCGTKMRPAGSCFVCEGCGSTSGCS
jgi:ribonucleoside-diphosphate reductase alpha chain